MTARRKKTIALIVFDVLVLVIFFNALAWTRGVIPIGHWITYALVGPALILMAGLYLVDGYKVQNDMLSLEYASIHILAMLGITGVTLLYSFVFLPSGFTLQQSRSVIMITFLLVTPATIAARRFLHIHDAERQERSKLIFIGDDSSASDFTSECERLALPQQIIVAHPGVTTGTSEQLDTLLHAVKTNEQDIEAIVLREAHANVSAEISEELVQLYFQGIPTYTLELFHQVYWRKIPIYRLNPVWLFQEGFKITREPVFERLKRMSDIVLSSIGLIGGLPLIIGASLWIKLDSPSEPVFFRQQRIGQNRRPFSLLKFRTMRSRLPANAGSHYTQDNDPRITLPGKILRATRLDEWPQMWNVFKGDMSLIGPRAEWDELVDSYAKQIPCYHFRHLIRPGITGWAQVNYPYGANLEDTIRKLEYDLYYIRHFSFRLDASIVLKTIHIMLFGKGR